MGAVRTIPNKSTELPFLASSSVHPTYGDLLRHALNVAPQGGFSVKEMRARFRVIDAIEKAEKESSPEIPLEDADFAVAKEAVGAVRWAVLDKELLEFLTLFE